MNMFKKLLVAFIASVFSLSALAATKVQFALDWKFEGPICAVFLGD